MRIGIPNGVKLKKPNPSDPLRMSSLLTTRLGAVATRVIIPLINAAMEIGIISRLAAAPVLCETRRATGMKMATTPVELMKAPRVETTAMSRAVRRVSLLPAVRISQSPSFWATPVRTRPSPITNRAPRRMMLESLNPARASFIVITPVIGSTVSMISATASMRGLFMANIAMAVARSPRTMASWLFTGAGC